MASALVLTGMALGALIVICVVFVVLSKLLQLGVRVADRQARISSPVDSIPPAGSPLSVAELPQREASRAAEARGTTAAAERVVTSPMPGNILSVKAKTGDVVKAGDVLLILESMKVQNEVRAPVGGEIVGIYVSERSSVRRGDRLVSIAVAEKPPTLPQAVSVRPKTTAQAEKPSPSLVSGARVVNCPMPGTIVSIKVTAGDAVKAGDVLLILESMKIQNEIRAPKDGRVKEIHVAEGENVRRGERLLTMS